MIPDKVKELLKNVLVFDIETSSMDTTGPISISDFNNYVKRAKAKWIGFYSYKYEKCVSLPVVGNEDIIRKFIKEHKVLVGFNNEEFDTPICFNNLLISQRYKQIDIMRILGSDVFKGHKNRASLMGVKLKNNKLKNMAKQFNVETQKGDIDYKIFQKDVWTKEEQKEIKIYLEADVMATKQLFDKLLDYWSPFVDMVDDKFVNDWSWATSSIASLTYKCACHTLGVEPTFGEHKGEKEKMGGRVILPKMEEARGVWYVDARSLYPHIYAMFNLHNELEEKNMDACDNYFNGNEVFKVKGTYDIDEPSILGKDLMEKLKMRMKLKKEDPDNPMQYAIKILLNSHYGAQRSPIFEQIYTPNGGWDCCWLGQQINEIMEKMMTGFGFNVIAGDSVGKDSKIYSEKYGYISIEEYWNKQKALKTDIGEKEIKLINDKILTCDNNKHNNYCNATQIIRHKCDKKKYRVYLTQEEYLDVTEDHSLIFLDGEHNFIEKKPTDTKYILYNRDINNGFCVRKILKIEEIFNNNYVYDLSVPNIEKFYANNILVHNTDSIFCKATEEKFNHKEYVKVCLKKIVEYINQNVPFPQETFEIEIEGYLDYIMWSTDLKTGETKKKNYVYLKNNKVSIIGLPVMKDNATVLGKMILNKSIIPMIKETKSAKFDKKELKYIINKYLEREDFLDLMAKEFKVKPSRRYKLSSQIQAQISEKYFNNDEGSIMLIKNKRVGKVGKGKKYCSVAEAKEAKLTIFDIDFEKLYNELQPFCKDAYLDDDKDRKVMESYLDSKQKELDSFIDNDLFDSAAVGDDIDDKEFIENEIFFECM